MPTDSGLPDVFHRINRMIPDSQRLATVPPSMAVPEALGIMTAGAFSQIPVSIKGAVLGLFSYRSLVRFLLHATKPVPLSDLTVGECMDSDPHMARASDEVSKIFDRLDRDDAVLVGEPDRLQAILAPMDVLRYLYAVASPFVLISEIELAFRRLIRSCSDDVAIEMFARRSLARRYAPDAIPTVLEAMSFGDYMDVVCWGENWPAFQSLFGGSRDRMRAKLDELRELRNVIVHLKRSVTAEEYERLVSHRDWTYAKVREAYLSRGEE